MNSFIEKLFEPSVHPEPRILDTISVPLNIGSIYKTAMIEYAARNNVSF